jgi:hypothetical protein
MNDCSSGRFVLSSGIADWWHFSCSPCFTIAAYDLRGSSLISNLKERFSARLVLRKNLLGRTALVGGLPAPVMVFGLVARIGTSPLTIVADAGFGLFLCRTWRRNCLPRSTTFGSPYAQARDAKTLARELAGITSGKRLMSFLT